MEYANLSLWCLTGWPENLVWVVLYEDSSKYWVSEVGDMEECYRDITAIPDCFPRHHRQTWNDICKLKYTDDQLMWHNILRDNCIFSRIGKEDNRVHKFIWDICFSFLIS